MTSIIQRSFAGGEISPSLYARADQVKYATGLRVCKNFIVQRHGGVTNRAGFSFVGEVKDSTKTVKLVPFVFNANQTYALEFGDLYMRVVRNGVVLTDVTVNITAITNANPAVVTSNAHGLANGEEVTITGVTGAMAQFINGRNFKLSGVTTNTFNLLLMDGSNANSTSWGAYTSGGTAARIYTITTPYVYTDLPELQHVQSADVVTLTHPNYLPRELRRTGHTSWTLSTITFEPAIARPSVMSVTAGGAGSKTFRYRATAVTETFEESLPGLGLAQAISGVGGPGSVLHFDGSDGSTTIVDQNTINTWTVAGNAQIDTAQSKFGGSSLLLDGSGDWVECAALKSLHGGGWTMEGFIRQNTLPVLNSEDSYFSFITGKTGNGFGALISLNDTGGTRKLHVRLSSNGTSHNIADVLGTKTDWNTAQWYHIALVYDPSVGKYFAYVDGVLEITVNSATKVNAGGQTDACIRLGARGDASAEALDGWIEEFRLSTECRYPGGTSFTPPVAAFSYARNPVNLVITGHTFEAGEEIYVTSVGGTTELNDRSFLLQNVTTDRVELVDEDGTNHGTYTSGGKAWPTFGKVTSAADPTTSNPHTITWGPVAGARDYNVYREINGVFGFIGAAVGTSFSDTGIVPDVETAPPIARNPFVGTGNFPSTVTYAQQRLTFANTDNNPETVYMSRTGKFHNFTTSFPSQDDDAVTFTLVGRQVSDVRNLFELSGTLVVLTENGEWAVEGNDAGTITPGDINAKQHGYDGSSSVPPILIGNNAIYLQSRGTIVRDLRFDLNTNGYAGRDLTVFANHLFDGFSITDWAFQKIPHSVTWARRSDGALLGLTYLREHDIWGWHKHETVGSFENVCCVPEGSEDVLYTVVNRTIGGQTKRYIERQHSRFVTDIAIDAFFVDSGLTYDGRNTNLSHTMTLSGGTNWTVDETLTLTSSTAYFSAADVGNSIVLRSGSDTVTLNILGFTSTTVVTGSPSKTVPASLRNIATNNWGKAVDDITGLWHLEGQTVVILGDGAVVTSMVVTNGGFHLDRTYEIIHAGKGYVSDIETLNLEVLQSETLADKKMRVNLVTIFTQGTRGIKAGPDEDHLKELPIGNDVYEDTSQVVPEKVEIVLNSTWNDNGRVLIRQDDPLPMTILAVVPSGYVGG